MHLKRGVARRAHRSDDDAASECINQAALERELARAVIDRGGRKASA
jgi:hypothetical protein